MEILPNIPLMNYAVCPKCIELNRFNSDEIRRVEIEQRIFYNTKCKFCHVELVLSKFYFAPNEIEAHRIAIDYFKNLYVNFSSQAESLNAELAAITKKVDKMNKQVNMCNSMVFTVQKYFKDIVKFTKAKEYSTVIDEATEAMKLIDELKE